MPLEHTVRNYWVSLATALAAVACCLLAGCGGTVDPIMADGRGVEILAQEFDKQGSGGGSVAVALPDLREGVRAEAITGETILRIVRK